MKKKLPIYPDLRGTVWRGRLARLITYPLIVILNVERDQNYTNEFIWTILLPDGQMDTILASITKFEDLYARVEE